MQKKISRTLMESGRVKFVRLEKLRPNPSQPRRVFDPAGLQELAESIKTYGILQDDVEEVLDCYFRACAISTDCTGLAQIGGVLANQGRRPGTQEALIPPEYARFVNAILMTCGMYDGSGDFAVRVGVPAKSGVGGGIMAVVPSRMGIGIFSPALDQKGNSVAGIRLLELLSHSLDLSIF